MLFRRAMYFAATLATLATTACGPSGGATPEFVGLEDRVATVGEELFFEIRATDLDFGSLRFGLESAAPGVAGATLTPAGNGTSALFRWTPASADIGTWIFDFTVTDGINESIDSIVIEVRATAGNAPVFRQPAGAGTTLDLTTNACITLSILVDDADSADVVLTEEEPRIAGARLTEGDPTVWDWCPSPDQIASGDSFVLVLSADDGENVTLKHFLIVLRNQVILEPVDIGGFTIDQAGAACQLALPEPLEVERGSAVVVARDATKAEFEAFWGVTLPAQALFINSQETCPRINGGESFILRDSGGAVVDGPTPVMAEHETLQRIGARFDGTSAASWVVSADTAGATDPGITPADSAAATYLSEISDATGAGNFRFEFIEIGID